MEKVITRQEYLEGKATHHDYYGQFSTNEIKTLVLDAFPITKLKKAYEKDEHFNNIPLVKWDSLAFRCAVDDKKVKAAGDFITLAGLVCVLKETARQLIQIWDK